MKVVSSILTEPTFDFGFTIYDFRLLYFVRKKLIYNILQKYG